MKSKKQKKVLTISILLLIVLIILGLSYAWFVNSRGVATIAKIQSPGVIFISGGHGESTTAINLSYKDSDVSEDGTVHVKNVICIGSDKQKYQLEIAHTTNITGLTINIYPATESTTQSSDSVKYNYKGNDIYYNYDPKVGYTTGTGSEGGLTPLVCLNRNSVDNTIAEEKGNYHNATYGADETRVQKNAEPLYWIVEGKNSTSATSILDLEEKENVFIRNNEIDINADFDFKYAKFFVIEGVWNEKDKETDIVSIMVNSVETQNN